MSDSSSSSSSEGQMNALTRDQTHSDFMVETPEQVKLRKSADKFFKSKKKRRTSSMNKKFVCDHIGLTEIPEVSDLLTDHQDEGILFSDRTSRLSNRTHMSECVCLISTNYVYILNSRLEFEDDLDAIPISSIHKIVTSKVTDNAVIIFLDDYKTQLLLTPYKIELMMVLKNQYRNLTNEELEIDFLNSIDFPVNEDTIFEVNFIQTKDGVKMTLFCKSAGKS
ncbi:Myosin tail family protein [Tritrichomonas foetus]|uniref:Myosin tail family protein n=1 Tax=Tritrichomonas foetus TaxID=1144522 RepID=A0A1J4KXU9_9EUKA|nr:Myosin tail family protein [Tritrichomonas foetus]|eukprot:OHT16063.1 Myosin tail family protein [Tritrichomonas foetus]